jgi:8-oxo-dGTP diphosphatase
MAVLHGWKFCPRCRSALAADGTALRCGECGLVVYPNPAVAACALVERDGRLLLVRRAGDPERGKWDLPGGFVDEGELPEDAVRRELREETALEIELGPFFGVWTDWYGDAADAAYNVILVWRATAAGEPEPADDVSEARWFARDELPAADELAFVNVPLVVDAWRQQNA